MTEEQTAEHNRAFKRASELAMSEIPLHERQDLRKPGWWTRRKLKKALSLLARVLELHPENWSAMWLVGKINQRNGDLGEALVWFERAYQVNASHADIAREASLCAMTIGNHEAAITFAHRATQIEPTNAGLHANLALAFLLAGRVSDAQASIQKALTEDPSDSISETVSAIIQHFAASGDRPPATTPALEVYWRKNRDAKQSG